MRAAFDTGRLLAEGRGEERAKSFRDYLPCFLWILISKFMLFKNFSVTMAINSDHISNFLSRKSKLLPARLKQPSFIHFFPALSK